MTVVEEIGFLAFICGLIACGASKGFAKRAMNFELRADYLGKYIWRGQNADDDLVFQPALSASYKGLTAAIWGNLELTNINDKSGDFSELDYSLGYSRSFPDIEGVEYLVGVIYYDFHSCNKNGIRCPDTTELYWGFSLNWPLSPSVTVYHDVDEADGTYVSTGLSYAIEKVGELSADMPVGLEIGAGLGWGSNGYNRYYWAVDGGKLNDLSLSLSLPIPIAGWSVTPSVNYITLLSGGIRQADTYNKESDYFFAGIGLSRKF